MKIIIVGAGEVGFHLAQLLSLETQEITLIDNDQDKLQYADNHLDLLTLRGDGTSIKILEEANVKDADLLIAVTFSETVNITSCIIGKQLGAKTTIARINNTEFLNGDSKVNFKTLGIDSMISPEDLAAREIQRLIKGTAFTDIFEFAGGELFLMGIHIEEIAPIIDKSLAENFNQKPDMNVTSVAIQRNGKTIIPKGNDYFRLYDHAYFITKPEGIENLVHMAGKEALKIKDIMILGGSRIGIKSATFLSKRYHVKLIEQDRDKCFQLSEQLPNALIINGDGRNVDILSEENIDEMDAFIAVTGNSETNIMSCLLAKARGVKKTIALVENIDYINLSQTIGIDTLINKKLLAASDILRHIRKGDIDTITKIHGVDAEVFEYKVKSGSKIANKVIKDLKFPDAAIIGGVIRQGNGYISNGEFEVKPDDKVVVFCMPEAIHKVEEFF